MPASAKTASKDAVNCPARSRIKNRKPAVRSPRSSKVPGFALGCEMAIHAGVSPLAGMATEATTNVADVALPLGDSKGGADMEGRRRRCSCPLRVRTFGRSFAQAM